MPANQFDKDTFAQAVELAAALLAGGQVQVSGIERQEAGTGSAYEGLADLISKLYGTVSAARDSVEEKTPPPAKFLAARATPGLRR